MTIYIYIYIYISKRQTLIKKICDAEILKNQNENRLCYTVIFANNKLNDVKNFCLLSATIEYILCTERLNVCL